MSFSRPAPNERAEIQEGRGECKVVSCSSKLSALASSRMFPQLQLALLNWPNVMDVALNILAATTPFLLAALAGISWLYRAELEKRRSIEERLSVEKFETYLIFINLFFDFFETNIPGKKKLDDKHVLGELSKFRRRVIVYGSEGVLREFINMMQKVFGGNLPTGEAADIYGRLVVEIRKDMGGSSTKMTPLDLLAMVVNDLKASPEHGLDSLIAKYRKAGLGTFAAPHTQ